MAFKKITGGHPILWLFLPLLIAACSKMDATYKDFIKNGSIVYVGSPDSVEIHPGKNRLMLKLYLTDQSATSAKIYWNNKSDSVSVPIEHLVQEVWFNDFAESSYSMDIFMHDNNGNSSVRTSISAKVYGDNYEQSLLSRPVTSATFAAGQVTIVWGSADPTVIGTTIRFKNAHGESKELFAPVSDEQTVLEDYNLSDYPAFSYDTSYLPDSLSLDTFYTAPETITVTGH